MIGNKRAGSNCQQWMHRSQVIHNKWVWSRVFFHNMKRSPLNPAYVFIMHFFSRVFFPVKKNIYKLKNAHTIIWDTWWTFFSREDIKKSWNKKWMKKNLRNGTRIKKCYNFCLPIIIFYFNKKIAVIFQ